MLVTDKLIYLEMPKTGCTHITLLLSKLFGSDYYGKHAPITRLPNTIDFKDKLIVSSIRNPWDWYISLWGYGATPVPSAKYGRGFLFHKLVQTPYFNDYLTIENMKLGFIAFGQILKRAFIIHYGYRHFYLNFANRKSAKLWREVYSDTNNPEYFRQWLKMLYAPERRNDLPHIYAQFMDSSLGDLAGLMTLHYGLLASHPSITTFYNIQPTIDGLREDLNKNNIVNCFIRQENLEDDLINALKKAGHPLGDNDIAVILASKKLNKSNRNASMSYYYDEETVKLVAEKEKILIDKFGYQPPIEYRDYPKGQKSL